MPGQNAREEGPRSGCKPGFEWLKPVTGSSDSYEAFFKGLKPGTGGVILAALAGPAEPVAVELVLDARGQSEPVPVPSCERGSGEEMDGAYPAIRIKALVDSFGSAAGQFTPICTDDYGPALTTLGDKIASSLSKP